MGITSEQFKLIEEFAYKKYKELDYAHGINHAIRTVKLTEFLAKKEKADPVVCKIAALLHQYHPEEAELVSKFLREINIDEVLTSQIVHCIESVARSTVYKAKSIEAKVVFDADKLQIIGPFGIIREFSHILESKNLNFHEALFRIKTLQIDIYENHLQTKTAKRLAKEPHKISLQFYNSFERWDKIIDI